MHPIHFERNSVRRRAGNIHNGSNLGNRRFVYRQIKKTRHRVSFEKTFGPFFPVFRPCPLSPGCSSTPVSRPTGRGVWAGGDEVRGQSAFRNTNTCFGAANIIARARGADRRGRASRLTGNLGFVERCGTRICIAMNINYEEKSYYSSTPLPTTLHDGHARRWTV